MATVTQALLAAQAEFLPGSAFPDMVVAGTNIPIAGLKFTPASNQICFFKPDFSQYVSGNLTVDVDWYHASATTGDVDFGASLQAITPNTDTQDIEADSLATENTVTDTHLGTTAKRLHRCSITVSNLDSLAAGDDTHMRLKCLSSSTIAAGVVVVKITVSFTV
jgi:hypothetical protein